MLKTITEFYLVRNNIGECLDIPQLYAITDDKKLAKKFRKTRRMEVFFEKTFQDVDYDKKETKYKLSDLRNYKLTETKLKTKNDENKIVEVPIVCSWYEEIKSVVQACDILEQEYQRCTEYDFRVLKDKYLEVLTDIKYMDRFYRTINQLNDMLAFYAPYFSSVEKSDYDYKVDELALFIKLFGYTLNEGGIK